MVVRPALDGRMRCPKLAKKMALISSDLPRENSATKATYSLSSRSVERRGGAGRPGCLQFLPLQPGFEFGDPEASVVRHSL
jgi:hypothetical protein